MIYISKEPNLKLIIFFIRKNKLTTTFPYVYILLKIIKIYQNSHLLSHYELNTHTSTVTIYVMVTITKSNKAKQIISFKLKVVR